MAKIIVDAFGGDNAPLEVIKGCEKAVKELGVQIILTGSESVIKNARRITASISTEWR